MGFQWDPQKDAANQSKHLVGFRQAAEVFRGFRLTREDTRGAYGEPRFITLGTYEGTVLCVVHTPRGDDIRIISAWKAGRHDREAYLRARDDGAV
ncbi:MULTISPECIES: BrnT family toxin [unclassified Methylobacterium]|uniref:BrnT family toxin n=1 Tax=unclassified Methylobacterium TaxID=2615210 RepID=UPI0009E995E0|nr:MULTISPECIES: BrnT family toxin [unclassified Methylobacterium]MCK2055668.1 BrnT family toxin [Methylobacterium sp. 37f]